MGMFGLIRGSPGSISPVSCLLVRWVEGGGGFVRGVWAAFLWEAYDERVVFVESIEAESCPVLYIVKVFMYRGTEHSISRAYIGVERKAPDMYQRALFWMTARGSACVFLPCHHIPLYVIPWGRQPEGIAVNNAIRNEAWSETRLYSLYTRHMSYHLAIHCGVCSAAFPL
ncbi:hypothetical protein BS47DRAFT_205322 [Hydnum rufescens UP504]|uniref:Uncharacterized protein n=1 Tax=Hydnum rufescens UP504 TaxID=1448309 RepID=A0A9P6DPA4_9AGAM|nr:hypothetical protein BS47DRAFT_205322 [Hydnum rufescens UP504]